ncbi:MAG: GNAT family N-acetyltransferase [Anaerovoracaceae bacterium]|jgi:GNAT superfamily N-acetyltransferase
MVREVREDQRQQACTLLRDVMGDSAPDCEGAEMWYYTLDDKMVGVLAMGAGDKLTALAVDEGYRGRSVATELFEAVKAVLMARARMTIHADVPPEVEAYFSRLLFRRSAEQDPSDGETVAMYYSI